jgi:hypothetical protein
MNMNDHIQQFNQRLIGLFESKAEEFTQYSQSDASQAPIAAQIAGLYIDLVEVMRAA